MSGDVTSGLDVEGNSTPADILKFTIFCANIFTGVRVRYTKVVCDVNNGSGFSLGANNAGTGKSVLDGGMCGRGSRHFKRFSVQLTTDPVLVFFDPLVNLLGVVDEQCINGVE